MGAVSFKKLKDEIISCSVADNWEDAILEWKDHYIFTNKIKCLCGHDIQENCAIYNFKTKKVRVVGNVCIKKITGSDFCGIFRNYKKIKKNNQLSVNKEFLLYSIKNLIINRWEYDFYKNIILKKKLTQKQKDCKVKINNKIIKYIERYKKV